MRAIDRHLARLALINGTKVSLLSLALLTGGRASGQESKPTPNEQPDKPVIGRDAAAKPAPTAPDIVVYGGTTLTSALKDVASEQVYDPDRVSSYGVGSVGELLSAITSENGDDEPQILINGQPTRSLTDISDLPVEAVARIEQLPRGSAVAVGGRPGQRAYNIVLKGSVSQRTATATYQVPTQGGWHNAKAEGLVTYIKNDDRLNLSLRGGWSDSLLESERGVIPITQITPYAPQGNVIATSSGGQIDPALSALAGQPVTVAAIPATSNPTLASFAATAGQINPSNSPVYRTLRGRSRPDEFALTGNKVLAPWLSLTFNGRLGWTADQRLSGLPSARFLLQAGHPNSPFTNNVVLAYSDPLRPLRSASSGNSVSMALTLNATFGDWRATLAGKYEDRARSFEYDTVTPVPTGQIVVPVAVNPFAGGLAALIPVTTTQTFSETATQDLQADIEGPVFTLPAGRARLRAGLGATWLRLDGSSTSGLDTKFRRHQYSASGGVTLPLTGSSDGTFKGLGQSDLTADASATDLGNYGSVHSLALALNWQPRAWLRMTASQNYEELAGYPELLAAPTTITPNVLYFDPVTGNSVSVTLVSGGGGNLRNETQRIRHLSFTLTPWRKYNLQVSSDFVVTDVRNQAGALPLPTPGIIAAFPDRFVRDGSGQLILVDSRTVNFDRQHTSEMRTGFSLSVPLANAKPVPRTPGKKRKAPSRPVLQASGSFTHIFASTGTIRETLGTVDLLAGGGVGLYGGRPRDSVDASLGISDRGVGVRSQVVWRGRSYLASGTAAAPDRLTFDAYARFDLKFFADLAQLFGPSPMTNGTRVTIGVENIGNTRQTVRNQAGITPLGYQAVYRDPLGRLISIELRKTF